LSGRDECIDESLIEDVAKAAAERVVAVLARRMLEELKAIRERLDRIEAMMQKQVGQRQHYGGRGGIVDRVREVLERDRYILASQARGRLGLSPRSLMGIVSGMSDVRVIEAGGDFIVFDRIGFEEFRALLSSIDTSDPEEASRMLGPFKDAFNALRRSGGVYFDGRSRSWRLLG